jgi:DNA-binding NtrC family response regulator
MRDVVDLLDEAADRQGPVIVEGEAGTGKEFAARYIHYSGQRSAGAFSTLQVTVLPPELLDVELYESPTGKLHQTQGGSLLLKEMWAMPRRSQARLARILESAASERTPLRAHDVRLMMTSSMPLDEAVATDFVDPLLADLLQSRRIMLPPLRRRPSDIEVLTELFLRQMADDLDRPRFRISPRVIDRMAEYGWPGNVAELKQVVRQLVVRSADGKLEEAHLEGLLPSVEEDLPLDRYSLEELIRAKLKRFLQRIRGYRVEGLHAEVMGRVERPLLELVMQETGGNQVKAAGILGINRNTLRKKLRRLSVPRR